MAFLEFLTEARNTFFKQKDPGAAYKLVQPYLWKKSLSTEERRAAVELGGLILRAQKKYVDARKLYIEINDFYQSGYCDMLAGNVEGARSAWQKVVKQRENHWCLSLFGLINRQLNTYPTTFQVRNHIESDIANLIHAGQFQYLDNLLSYAEFLSQLNLEAYKFMGRALMINGFLDQAGTYLVKGQKSIPNDPEIYYHLAQYSLTKHQDIEAKMMANQCLLISPFYTPAQRLLEKLPAS